MEYLTESLADFQDRLDGIANIEGINLELITIFRNNLDSIRKDVKDTGKFGALLKKIDTQKNMLDQIEKLPEFATKYETLREQSTVLMIGAFEVFIGDVFKNIANNNPEFFIWPEKEKRISIEVENFTSSFTLGDAMIAHLSDKQYSFQDLGSIIKAVNNYLGVQLEVSKDTKRSIVLGTSYRHLIVHKGSVVDKRFLTQTREVEDIAHQEGDRLRLGDDDIDNIRIGIIDFSETLIQVLTQRDELKEEDNA